MPRTGPPLTTFAPIISESPSLIPTGNLWVSLPEIERSDGNIASVGVLHERSAGMLEARGGSFSLLEVHIVIDGLPRRLSGLTWTRAGHWMPHAQADIGTGSVEIWYCTPPDERGFALRLRYHHHGPDPADVELGWIASWQVTLSTHLRSTELDTTITGADDDWTGSRVLTCRSGLPLLAIGFQGGDQVQLGQDGSAAGVRATEHAPVGAGEHLTAELYVAVAPESDGAASTALHLRRRGFDDLWSSGMAWLAEHALPVADFDPRDELAERVNSNLFFNYFFAQGMCLDTGRSVMLTSRSPRYYVSAAFWSRDAFLWTFPAILLTDPGRARTLLVASLDSGRSRLADHALYINGTPLYPGFELDQAAAPVLAVMMYQQATGDRSVLEEEPVTAYLSDFPELIDPWKHPHRTLYGTFLLPTDDPTDHRYTTTGNSLVACAFEALASLALASWKPVSGPEAGQSGHALADRFRQQATAIRSAIKEVLTVESSTGTMWAWACDPDESTQLADEPPLSLRTLPFWGLGSESDALQGQTRRWLNEQNPHTYQGNYPGSGSSHFPYPSGFDLANRLIDGDNHLGDPVVQFLETPMDEGLACESWDPKTGRVRTGAAMASMSGLLAWTVWARLTGRRRWYQPITRDRKPPSTGPGVEA